MLARYIAHRVRPLTTSLSLPHLRREISPHQRQEAEGEKWRTRKQTAETRSHGCKDHDAVAGRIEAPWIARVSFASSCLDAEPGRAGSVLTRFRLLQRAQQTSSPAHVPSEGWLTLLLLLRLHARLHPDARSPAQEGQKRSEISRSTTDRVAGLKPAVAIGMRRRLVASGLCRRLLLVSTSGKQTDQRE